MTAKQLASCTMESIETQSARLFNLVDLNGVRGGITGKPVNFHLPCTVAKDQLCQVIGDLSVWNEVLCYAKLQLQERWGAPGQQLALVSFDEPRSPEFLDNGQVHRATTLASWLLKTHRCIAVLDVSDASLHACEALVCSTPLKHSSVKILKLNIERFMNHKVLGEAISTMVGLEELDCAGNAELSYEFSQALCKLVRSTISLSTLRVSGVLRERKGVIDLLNALQANTTLQKLSITDSLAYCRAFVDCLSTGCPLTSLTVVAFEQPWSLTLEKVLDGLLIDTTITNVRLENFVVDQLCAQLILKVTASNQVLRSFEVVSTRCKVMTQTDSACNWWLGEVSKNKTLELLSLPLDIFSAEQWGEIFHLFATSRTLKVLSLQVAGHEDLSLGEVCRVLTESGASDKVQFTTCVVPEAIDMLRCLAFSSVVASVGSPPLASVIEFLPSCAHITSLRLVLGRGDLDDQLSSVIAAFLSASTTTALRHFQLVSSERGSNSAWGVIVSSLFQNVSIRELALDATSMPIRDVELLADAIKSSPSIFKVRLKTSTMRRTGAFVRALAANISANYKLLSIIVNGTLARGAVQEWFNIWDTMRRNSSLVARAARFVSSAPCDRYCARALERVSDHPALLEKIAELASVSETEARSMVRRSLAEMQPVLAFMRLTGVVRNELVFDQHSTQGLHLGVLNEDCWRHVRSFLLLDDVEDSVV